MRILTKTLYGFVIIVLLAFGLYCMNLLRRAFIADKFLIPTESMAPTLVSGNEVWVNKLLMGARIYTDFHLSLIHI